MPQTDLNGTQTVSRRAALTQIVQGGLAVAALLLAPSLPAAAAEAPVTPSVDPPAFSYCATCGAIPVALTGRSVGDPTCAHAWRSPSDLMVDCLEDLSGRLGDERRLATVLCSYLDERGPAGVEAARGAMLVLDRMMEAVMATAA